MNVPTSLPLSLAAMTLLFSAFFATPEGAVTSNAGAAAAPAPFRAWDGTWEGTFATYRTDGTKVSEIRVKQTYRSESDDLQTGTFEDTDAAGAVVRSTARNVREKDGSLRCEVTRVESGKTTVHRGRIEDGFLFWFRTVPDEHLEECFRERVVDGRTYEIDGVGIYGERRETVHLFAGRYRRTDAAPR